MPKYDYKCLETGNIFEVQQKMTDDPLERCICCKERFLVQRIISKPTLVINGAGSMPDRKLYKELDID